MNDNMSWYCGKPRDTHLQCSDIKGFQAGFFDVSAAHKFEKLLIPSVEYLKHPVNLAFNSDQTSQNPITSNTNLEKCSRRSSVYSWREGFDQPSGYWFNKTWIFYNCSSSIRHDPATYRQCLKGKTLYFFGDSTVMQYVRYTVNEIMNLPIKEFADYKGNEREYHYRQVMSGQGKNLLYFKHAMPFHYPNFLLKVITSIPTELDRLSQSQIPDKDLIVFVSYDVHFHAFPISAFKDRILKLVRAVKYFLSVNPKRKCFSKALTLFTTI